MPIYQPICQKERDRERDQNLGAGRALMESDRAALLAICIATMVFSLGVLIGDGFGKKDVRTDIRADCAVTGSFRIDNDAYQCVKITRAGDEAK